MQFAMILFAVLAAEDTPAVSAAKPKLIDVNGVMLTATEQAMLGELNAFRTRSGLVALRPTTNLMNRARRHARWMAGNGSMTHSSGIQENIAYGQRSARDVTNVWINSGGHNANMRTGNKECGVAVATSGSGQHYWAQQFATGSEKWGEKKVPQPVTTQVAASHGNYVSYGNTRHRRLGWRRR